jgi:hypothetical protein
VLVRNKAYKDGLQSIAQEHLLPLFGSPYPFLRAKAAWIAGVFVGEVEFSTSEGTRKKGHGAVFDDLFDSVLRCMKDSYALHAASVSPIECSNGMESFLSLESMPF